MSEQEKKSSEETEKPASREIEIDVHDEKEILNRKTAREKAEENK